MLTHKKPVLWASQLPELAPQVAKKKGLFASIKSEIKATMPTIAIFFGIIVRMWHDDHPPPHIHVEYQGFEALVTIETGLVSQGELPRKVATIVRDWCLLHQAELLNNWEKAQHFKPLDRIQGADRD
jgi:hypothetical protein